MDIPSSVTFLKIVGEGSGATIDADSKGRVLNVQNGASVTIKDITLKKGSAVTGGGVCVASGGTFTMESGSVSTCNASGAGGGIYSEGTLSIQEGSITGNNATGNSSSGGGIQVAGGSVSIAETGVTIQNNSSGAYGNNIFISSSATATIPTGDKALYDDNGGTNGKADTVCYASGNNFARFNKPHATNTQINAIISQFTGNATIYLGMTTSTPTPWKCNATDIASACTQNLTIKPTKTGTTTTIQYNGSSDTTDYLIHFNKSDKTLTLTNLILDGNSQKCGIVKLEAGTLNATNCTFQYGKAKTGGGLNVASGTRANLNSCIVENCSAEKFDSTFGSGGGIFTWGIVNFSGTIQSCSAKGLGGGVYIGSGTNAKFNMTEGTISNCRAETETTTSLSTGRGGGVCVYGTFTMSDSTVTGCTAENGGIGAGAYLIAANAITPVLIMSDNACVGSNNEVYLDSSSKIKIVGNLNATVAAKIRLYTCLGNPQVLIDDSSGTKVASCYNKFTLSANGYCIDKDGIVKEGYLAETAPSHISSMTATGTVKVIGDISATTIANLNAALKTLYANNSSVRVTLDLSQTTGLTELPSKAFADTNLSNPGCLALKGIVLPTGLTKIGDWAFYRCSNLTEMITIPPTVTEICNEPFCYSGLSGTLNIPSSVSKFGYRVFADTSSSLTLQYEDTTSTWTRYDSDGIVTDSTAFYGTTPTKADISKGSYRLLYLQKD